MVIRSICIWIAVFIVWILLMTPATSRQEAHEQKNLELEKNIAKTKIEYKREENYKSKLMKHRDQLAEQIQYKIKTGEEAIRLLKED